MARPRTIDEKVLIARLARVFSDVGYEGASLALLSRATGLQRASLYHRFPGGKQQMAEEVLAATGNWLEENVLAPLTSGEPPQSRLATVAANLDALYEGGSKACLLNMLSSPKQEEGPFGPAIRQTFQALISAFAALATDAGIPPAEARRRGERAAALLQGSLVLARGLGSTAPFRRFIAALPEELGVIRNPLEAGS